MKMFCATCGQQIPDASETCPVCGHAAAIPLPPPSASRQATPPPPGPAGVQVAPYPAQSLRGVGGWLLFFCIAFTILWPLWALAHYAFYGHFALRLATVLGLLRVALGIAVGLTLWMEQPAGMVLLRVYFAVAGLLTLWSLGSLVLILIRYNVFFSFSWLRVLPNTGLSVVFLVAGVLYFSQSERVRATYGSKLF